MLYTLKELLKYFKVLHSYVRRISLIALYIAHFPHNILKCVLTYMVNGVPWKKGGMHIQNIVRLFLSALYTKHHNTMTFFNGFFNDVKQSHHCLSNLCKNSRFLDGAEKEGRVGD